MANTRIRTILSAFGFLNGLSFRVNGDYNITNIAMQRVICDQGFPIRDGKIERD